MSEVKRYDISAFGGMSMDECTDGAYVSYEDYAELEAKCAALAAENAGLNDKMNKLLVWPGIEFYSSAWEFCNFDGNDALEFMCDKETPATDAFMAEVRAQGVEMYADNLDNGADDAERGGFDDAVKFLRSEASGVRLFASQLRKGGEQK